MNNRLLLKGFIIKDMIQTMDLEMILFEMARIIEERASIAYRNLVKWQTERIVDEITLNMIKRPDQCSILDMAISEVQRRIIYAEKRMQCTEFNLYVGIQIYTGKLDKKNVLYLKMICPNDIYSKQLKSIPELVPYDIYESDISDPNSEKAQFLENLEGKYQKSPFLTATLINYENLSIEPSKFVFRSPEKRADDFSKEKILNQLLASYACDQEIPPNKLMEYTLQAMNRFHYKDIMSSYEKEKEVLTKLLPEIDLEMVTRILIEKQEPAS